VHIATTMSVQEWLPRQNWTRSLCKYLVQKLVQKMPREI